MSKADEMFEELGYNKSRWKYKIRNTNKGT